MLKNYFKIAIRNLAKYKSFSIINILGLALSMSVCLVLIMVVADQASNDRYISNSDSIYRINTIDLDEDNIFNTYATAPLPLWGKLQKEYDGIISATRIRRGFGNDWIEIDQNVNIPIGGFFVDPAFLTIFEYELESGNPETALSQPNSVVLKKKTAQKLYGDKNPVGEIITVGELGDYIITGVLRDNKEKSHIKFEALASISSLLQIEEQDSLISASVNNWRNHFSGWIYLELDQNKSISALEKDLLTINKEIYSEVEDRNIKFSLQALTDISPGPLRGNEIGPTLPMLFVYFMGGLALIVMISASFNYMNLSMARALNRAKEVGIRKVSGATKRQLISQFLMEAIILSLGALLISYVILIALKPSFQDLNFSRLLHWDLQDNSTVYLISILFAITVGFLSGLGPALLLSSFRPIKVLKDLSGIRLISRTGLRKVLIVAQFSISLIFIISVSVLSKQINLFFNAEFGFTTGNIINARLNNISYSQLKTELLSKSPVQLVSGATHIPASGMTKSTNILIDPADNEGVYTGYFSVDEDYLEMLGLNLLSGTNFKNLTKNSNEVIINVTAVEKFGYKSIPSVLGELIYDDDSVEYRIIGVVEDYHHQAMTAQIIPMFLQYNPEEVSIVHVKLVDINDNQGTMAIESAYSSINPDIKTTYKPFQEELIEFYDLMFGDLKKIVGIASILALVIACLGLLGMATYTVETRLKEVSIRKILGATDKQLIYQLSRGFLILLLVAIVISAPIAYILNNQWLELIAYRVEITFGLIAGGIGILILFGILTIGSQTYRAGSMAPIDNLRSE